MSHDDIARIIGSQVRAGRARQGLTRKQLATVASVSERYLNDLENGEANPSIGVLGRIADALGCSLAGLLSHPDPDVGQAPAAGLGAEPLRALFATMSISEQEGAIPLLEAFLDERRRAARGLALLGLRGAGKTTLGGLLAARHGLRFVSVTREIEARAGMSLADLFNLGGSDVYRSLEYDVIADLVKGDGRLVLETAGGIVGNSRALALILGAFRTVWLKASPEEHLARVAGQGDTRPMRDHPQALEHLKALLGRREPDYARAECVVDTSGRSIEACLADIEALAAPLLAGQGH